MSRIAGLGLLCALLSLGQGCDRERGGGDAGLPELDGFLGGAEDAGDPDLAGGGGIEVDGGLIACATESTQAALKPLDVYLMVDSSGSMNETTMGPGTPTKWAAVGAAINGFLDDPASTGIGIGVQFFPIVQAGTSPQACSSDAICGALAPCINNMACVQNGALKYCATSADCPGNVTCAPVGTCAQNAGLACFTSGGAQCGSCKLYTLSYCSGRDSCTASDYQSPAAPIAVLPGAAPAISSALSARMPDGLTPTAAALRGAVDHSIAYALAHPDHVVVTVLATDGFPTECSPQDIPAIAAIAASGLTATPSVRTFAIGVFSAAEQAQATTNLDQIAMAGGSGSAFIISTTQNVTQAFLAALDSIRGASLPCEFALPVPADGTPDYDLVNVQFTGGGTTKIVPRVSTTAACDPLQGGWVYDVDPGLGKPTKLILCDKSCDVVRASAAGQIDIVQGCKTIIL